MLTFKLLFERVQIFLHCKIYFLERSRDYPIILADLHFCIQDGVSKNNMTSLNILKRSKSRQSMQNVFTFEYLFS